MSGWVQVLEYETWKRVSRTVRDELDEIGEEDRLSVLRVVRQYAELQVRAAAGDDVTDDAEILHATLMNWSWAGSAAVRAGIMQAVEEMAESASVMLGRLLAGVRANLALWRAE